MVRLSVTWDAVCGAQLLYMVPANGNDSVVDCTIQQANGKMGVCINMLILLLDDTRLPFLNSTFVDMVSAVMCCCHAMQMNGPIISW